MIPEQEAREAWACADRLAEALASFLNGADNGIVSVKVDKQARQALAAYRAERVR